LAAFFISWRLRRGALRRFFAFLAVAARRLASLFCFLGGFGEKKVDAFERKSWNASTSVNCVK
jgi:hypothetical protein